MIGLASFNRDRFACPYLGCVGPTDPIFSDTVEAIADSQPDVDSQACHRTLMGMQIGGLTLAEASADSLSREKSELLIPSWIGIIRASLPRPSMRYSGLE